MAKNEESKRLPRPDIKLKIEGSSGKIKLIVSGDAEVISNDQKVIIERTS